MQQRESAAPASPTPPGAGCLLRACSLPTSPTPPTLPTDLGPIQSAAVHAGSTHVSESGVEDVGTVALGAHPPFKHSLQGMIC